MISRLILLIQLSFLFCSQISFAKIPPEKLAKFDHFEKEKYFLNPIFGAVFVESGVLKNLFSFVLDSEHDESEVRADIKDLFQDLGNGLQPGGNRRLSYYFTPHQIGKLVGNIFNGHQLSVGDVIADPGFQDMLFKSRDDFRQNTAQQYVFISDYLDSDETGKITENNLHKNFKKSIKRITKLSGNPLQRKQFKLKKEVNRFLTIMYLQSILWFNSQSSADFDLYLESLKKEIGTQYNSQLDLDQRKKFSREAINIMKKLGGSQILLKQDYARIGDLNWPDCGETSIRNFIRLLIGTSKGKNLVYDTSKLYDTTTDVVNYFKDFDTQEKQLSPDARNAWGKISIGLPKVDYIKTDSKSGRKYEISGIGGSDNILNAVNSLIFPKQESINWIDIENKFPNFRIIKIDLDHNGTGSLFFKVDDESYEWIFSSNHYDMRRLVLESQNTLISDWLTKVQHSESFNLKKTDYNWEDNHLYFGYCMLGKCTDKDSNSFFASHNSKKHLYFLNVDSDEQIIDALVELTFDQSKLFSQLFERIRENQDAINRLIEALGNTENSDTEKKFRFIFGTSKLVSVRHFSDKGIQSLALALLENENLQELKISNSKLAQIGSFALSKLLKVNKNIKLDFDRIDFSGSDLSIIINSFEPDIHTDFTIKNSRLSNIQMQIITSAIEKGLFNFLNLRSSLEGDDQFIMISKALSSNPHLKDLDIGHPRGRKFSENAAQAYYEALINNNRLEFIEFPRGEGNARNIVKEVHNVNLTVETYFTGDPD